MSTTRVVQKMVGPTGKTPERARYVELIRQGMNNSEICRVLGIGRKTGSKWRNGHTIRDPKSGRRYTASLMMRKLSAYPRQNGLATALRELGSEPHRV